MKKETTQIRDTLLKHSAEEILKRYGLDFSGEKIKELSRAFVDTAKESGKNNPELLAELLINKNLPGDELDILLKNLTVGETYFFRDEKLFSALQSEQVVKLFKKKNHITVWSAGCASGEEPYSIAILFDKFFSKNFRTHVKIFAGDINKHSIEKGRKGLYREWSFRSTPEWVKNEYFIEHKKGVYEIKDSIKNKVEFSLTNLSEIEKIKNDSAKFDIIICRNVLIYFSKPLVKILLETFHHKLNSDGLYITTASESININKNIFSKFIEGNNTIFVKNKMDSIFSLTGAKQKKEISKKELPAKKIAPVKKDFKTKTSVNELDLSKIYNKAISEYENKNNLTSLKLFEHIEKELKSSKQKFINEAELYFYLIGNYIKLANLDKANQICDASLKKERLDYRFHFLHGILLQENGEFDKAEEAFNKSIYLNNKFPLSYFELANLQMSSGKNSYKRNFQKSFKLLLDLEEDEIIKYSDGISASYLLKQITLLTD